MIKLFLNTFIAINKVLYLNQNEKNQVLEKELGFYWEKRIQVLKRIQKQIDKFAQTIDDLNLVTS